jgi:putative molybdopterin biosynthesis protein
MDSIMSASPRLTQLRRERGWSQADLAERSGVSRAGISAIETDRLVPSVAAALRIAAALGQSVEALFGPGGEAVAVEWAWTPGPGNDGRVWQASVHGRTRVYPAEVTAAGVLPHDAWFDGRRLQARSTGAPEATLVVAGCDPTAGLLVREIAQRHRVRVLPLLRSSAQAVELLRQGLVHAAGLHVSDPHGRSANERVVRASLGAGYRLIHQVRWESGIAITGRRRERSAAALLRANLRWVNREEGSAARQTFDTLLASRRRPAGYDHVVRDHRAVAATVASGWAEAGICVRPTAADAGLSFVPVQTEAYELCVADASMDDPRVAALVETLQSSACRRLMGDLPGCRADHTGDVRRVA